MSTTPAVLTIFDEIEARLKNIKTGNGYWYTPGKIKRASLKAWENHDLPALNFWGTTLGNIRAQYNDDRRQFQLFVEGANLTLDEPFMDVSEKMASDIITGLNRATSAPKVSDDPSYDLGETVTDLEYEGHDYLIGEAQKPWCGVLVRWNFKYHANPFDMFNYDREE